MNFSHLSLYDPQFFYFSKIGSLINIYLVKLSKKHDFIYVEYAFLGKTSIIYGSTNN